MVLVAKYVDPPILTLQFHTNLLKGHAPRSS